MRSFSERKENNLSMSGHVLEYVGTWTYVCRELNLSMLGHEYVGTWTWVYRDINLSMLGHEHEYVETWTCIYVYVETWTWVRWDLNLSMSRHQLEYVGTSTWICWDIRGGGAYLSMLGIWILVCSVHEFAWTICSVMSLSYHRHMSLKASP